MRVNIEVTAGPARGKVFSIDQADLFIVGRAKDSKISLPNDPYLSRQHFVLEIAPPNCRITDLGSKNGTFVNGIRYGGRKADATVKQAPNGLLSVSIRTGEIVVGDTRMKVQVDSRLSDSGRRPMPAPQRRITDKQAAAVARITENLAPAGDSSLGFLAGLPAAANLQAVPVPAPGLAVRAVHVYAVPTSGVLPRSDAELKRRSVTPIPSNLPVSSNPPAPNLQHESNSETIKVGHGSDASILETHPTEASRRRPDDRTILDATPPGVESDRTIMERFESDATPQNIPLMQDELLLCTLCGLDVTQEVGARGRIAGAEYVCHSCRASRAFAAKERIARKAREPQRITSGAQFPAVKGMDLGKYSSLNYPGYTVVDVLGSGGMGVVYKAIRQSDGLVVAIKSLLPNVPVSFENYRIFHREIEITRKLRHPNIVEVLDHGRVKGAYFCVLEFVDGLSLKDYLIQMNGRLTLKQAAPLMLDVLSGLSAAHNATIETRASGPRMQSGIVHRDLKPENILLKRDAFGWTPKIADFGIAKSFESAGMTDMTIAGVCGTPTYWPREQLTHYRYLHPATDVFSVAAVFYEMLSGKCARPGMQETLVHCHRRSVSPELADFMRVIGNNPILPIRDVVPSIPAPIAQVIDKALLEVEVPLDEVEMRETLQNLRYPDAGAFRAALTHAFKLADIGI